MRSHDMPWYTTTSSYSFSHKFSFKMVPHIPELPCVVHRYGDPRYVARDGQNNYTRITRLIRYSLLGYSKGVFLYRGSPLNCRLPSWLRLLFFLQGIRLRVCRARAASVSPHLPQIPNIHVWNLKS